MVKFAPKPPPPNEMVLNTDFYDPIYKRWENEQWNKHWEVVKGLDYGPRTYPPDHPKYVPPPPPPKPLPVKIIDPTQVKVQEYGKNNNPANDELVCQIATLRNCFWYFIVPHVISAVAAFVLWFACVGFLPVRFLRKDYYFLPEAMADPYVSFLLVLEPCLVTVYHFFTFKYCGDKHIKKCKYILKIYYQILFWMQVLIFYIVYLCTMFFLKLDWQDVKGMLKHTMEGYFEHDKSVLNDSTVHDGDDYAKDAWDAIQYYFQCCGTESYNDWYSLTTNFSEQILPSSCCQLIAVERQRCWVNEVGPDHKIGCLDQVFGLYQVIGSYTMSLALFCIGVRMCAIVVARRYYVQQRRSEDPFYLAGRSWWYFLFDLSLLNWVFKYCGRGRGKHHGMVTPIVQHRHVATEAEVLEREAEGPPPSPYVEPIQVVEEEEEPQKLTPAALEQRANEEKKRIKKEGFQVIYLNEKAFPQHEGKEEKKEQQKITHE